MAKETLALKGSVFLQIWNSKGELLEEITQDNMIVNTGKQSAARLLGSADPDKRVNAIGFGTSGVAVNSSDVDLGAQVFAKALNGVTYSGTSAIFDYSLELSEANGNTIREFGLYTDDATLFARITRNAINKTSDIRLTGTWTITF